MDILKEFGMMIVFSILMIVILFWILTHVHSVMEFVFLVGVVAGIVYSGIELAKKQNANHLVRSYLMISKKTAIKNYMARYNVLNGEFRVIGRYRDIVSNLKQVETDSPTKKVKSRNK